MDTSNKTESSTKSLTSEDESNVDSMDSENAASAETAPNLKDAEIEDATPTTVQTDAANEDSNEEISDPVQLQNVHDDIELSNINIENDDDKKVNKEDVLENELLGDENDENEKVSTNDSKNNGLTDDKSLEKLSKGRKRKASDTNLEAEKTEEVDQEKKQKTNDLDDGKTESIDDTSFNEADLNLPPKQTFGKGKRARIPNKRYSDISLTNKGFNKSIENGSEKIESENDLMEASIKNEVSQVVPNVYVKSDESIESPTPPTKKTKIVDLSDPKYLKPFKYGWRRELVWRATPDSNNRRIGDIYYFTPQGKKVRSMREVAENLKNRELSIENFSYFKASLGLNDPEKEIIRNAKHPNSQLPLVKKALTKSTPKSPKLPATTTTVNKVASPKLPTSKVLSPKISSPKSPKTFSPKVSSPKITSPKITSPKISSPKIASPKIASPKIANQKISSPKVSNSKIASPKLPNTRASRSRMASPKVTSPEIASPKVENSKSVPTETPDIPKTRGATNKITPKVKVPPKKDKRSIKVEDTMEVESPHHLPKPAPPKKGRWSKTTTAPPAKPKKRTIKLSSITNSDEKEENKFMDNYLQNLSYGYNTLLYVFQYLKVQDLLRAGCVCTMWRDIASHPTLWRTVRMKNSQVHSFEGLANTLKKHGTRHLDLRKMLLPTGGDEIWPEFAKATEKVDTLRKIELCRCPATVVEKLAISNPHLEVINAVTIKCESMDLEPLKALTNIRELRLKSTGGLTLTSNLDSLRDMKELRHLSLTSIRDLDRLNLGVIAELTNLESLDLGECTDFPKTFGSEILVKLDKLEKLRLEKGQGFCHTFEILDAVKDMNSLEQLELVNFDIKAGFDKALGVCQNIKKLLIIPTYISQSATTNHMVLGGVLRLQKTLSHFVWGVTLELLRVTELFVDQCEEPDKKEKRDKKAAGNGDSIPVLKPVPLLMDRDSEIPPAHDPPQVEILALPSLQKLLMQNLPTTRVKILKIPFHATWRQSITDSVN